MQVFKYGLVSVGMLIQLSHMQIKKCGLAIECPGQIIANAYIVECMPSKPHRALPLKKEELEVQIYEVLDEWAKLPLPVPEKALYLVSDVNDIVVRWPKDLVVTSTKPVLNSFSFGCFDSMT